MGCYRPQPADLDTKDSSSAILTIATYYGQLTTPYTWALWIIGIPRGPREVANYIAKYLGSRERWSALRSPLGGRGPFSSALYPAREAFMHALPERARARWTTYSKARVLPIVPSMDARRDLIIGGFPWSTSSSCTARSDGPSSCTPTRRNDRDASFIAAARSRRRPDTNMMYPAKGMYRDVNLLPGVVSGPQTWPVGLARRGREVPWIGRRYWNVFGPFTSCRTPA